MLMYSMQFTITHSMLHDLGRDYSAHKATGFFFRSKTL